MSNKLNIELREGEDFYRLLTIQDSLLAPIDLTGYTFAGQIRAKYAADLYLTFSFTVKDQVTNKGEVEMKLAKALSSLKKISARLNYFYDVEMNDGANTTRILQGNCSIEPEVTK